MKSEFWRRAALALALAGVVIVSSMVLVRYRNRDRAMTTAVAWAFESLRAVPEDIVEVSFPPGDFRGGIDNYERQIRDGEIPVDSVRAFYADYALAARDGRWEAAEIMRLGRWLGMKPPGTATAPQPEPGRVNH